MIKHFDLEKLLVFRKNDFLRSKPEQKPNARNLKPNKNRMLATATPRRKVLCGAE